MLSFRLFDGEEVPFWDPTKIYLISNYEPGEVWARRIELEHQIAYEATSPYGTLYLAGLGLDESDYTFFLERFRSQERSYQGDPLPPYPFSTLPVLPFPQKGITPREAFFSKGIKRSPKEAVGSIVKETIVHCPPGIPVLLPGEVLQEDHLPYLDNDIWVLDTP
jgi:hypothetical protein